MDRDEILFDVEERMEKAVEHLKGNLAGIRTGRANPGLIDSLKVDVYGSPTPLKQIASVSVPEPTQLVIRPFDPNTLKEIEKAIQSSDLGFNPMNDGRVVRVNVPALSQEVRRKLVGRIKELGEEAKIAIRNVRRDGNKLSDQGQKDKKFSEDDRDDLKKEIQELTKRYEDRVTEMGKSRETAVMDE